MYCVSIDSVHEIVAGLAQVEPHEPARNDNFGNNVHRGSFHSASAKRIELPFPNIAEAYDFNKKAKIPKLAGGSGKNGAYHDDPMCRSPTEFMGTGLVLPSDVVNHKQNQQRHSVERMRNQASAGEHSQSNKPRKRSVATDDSTVSSCTVTSLSTSTSTALHKHSADTDSTNSITHSRVHMPTQQDKASQNQRSTRDVRGSSPVASISASPSESRKAGAFPFLTSQYTSRSEPPLENASSTCGDSPPRDSLSQDVPNFLDRKPPPLTSHLRASPLRRSLSQQLSPISGHSSASKRRLLVPTLSSQSLVQTQNTSRENLPRVRAFLSKSKPKLTLTIYDSLADVHQTSSTNSPRVLRLTPTAQTSRNGVESPFSALSSASPPPHHVHIVPISSTSPPHPRAAVPIPTWSSMQSTGSAYPHPKQSPKRHAPAQAKTSP